MSVLNNQTVALWVTKYAHVVPDVAAGVAVAAPSAHFGFELWFFDRTQGKAIIDAILPEMADSGNPMIVARLQRTEKEAR